MPRTSWSLLTATFVLLLWLAPTAYAQGWEVDGVTLTWDNDLLAGTDRHYTNGAMIALHGRLPADALPLFAGVNREWRLAVGQEIYTPEDVSQRTPVLDDRPYAGWLHLGLSLVRHRPRSLLTEQFGLDLGVVGPAAGAEEAQSVFHGLTGSDRPQGWGNQLRNEPTIRFDYTCELRLHRGTALGLDWEVSPRLELALGNQATFAALGGELRFGVVPDSFTEETSLPVALYLSLNAEARLVGWDLFLDGSLLWPGGPRVQKKRLVGEVSAGLTLLVRGALQVHYVHTFRTPQFEGQGAGDSFGSLSVTLYW